MRRYREGDLGLRRFAEVHGLRASQLHDWVYGQRVTALPKAHAPGIPRRKAQVFREVELLRPSSDEQGTVWAIEVAWADGTLYNDNYYSPLTYSPLTTVKTPQRRWVVLGASGGAGRRAVAGRPEARRNMITEKQRRVLRKVYARTQNMSVSAMKAGVDRKTAPRYLDHPQASPGPLRPHA